MASPFECPVCYEKFGEIFVPTTFPCGHSCCMVCVSKGLPSLCFYCKDPLPPLNTLLPSFTFRDAAILFFSKQPITVDEQMNNHINPIDKTNHQSQTVRTLNSLNYVLHGRRHWSPAHAAVTPSLISTGGVPRNNSDSSRMRDQSSLLRYAWVERELSQQL
jgi:hypothetical protein